jgi:hypothetical protein
VLRYLRIVFSATCAIACVLLVALWIRSFWRGDVFQFGDGQALASNSGSLQTIDMNLGQPLSSQTLITFAQPMNLEAPQHSLLGCGYSPADKGTKLVIPYWFPTLLLATMAAFPWIQWDRRFSLRTLLIVTTLVAVVLVLSVWLR